MGLKTVKERRKFYFWLYLFINVLSMELYLIFFPGVKIPGGLFAIRFISAYLSGVLLALFLCDHDPE
jgi:hypothetical protein